MTSKKSKGNHKTDIRGIILVTLGVFMILSVLAQSSLGIVGRFIKEVLIGFLGLGAYTFPFLIIFIGIGHFVKKGQITFTRKFYGIFILIINSLLMIQMMVMEKFYVNNAVAGGFSKFFNSQSVVHGGIISYLIDIPLIKLFGSVGSYILFFSVYIISLVLIFQITIADVISFMKELLPESKSNKEESGDKINSDLISSEAAVAEDVKTNYIKGINSKIKIIDFLKSAGPPEVKQEIKEQKEPIKGYEVPVENRDVEEMNQELEKEIKENAVVIHEKYEFPYPELLNSNLSLKMNKEDKRELISNAGKLEETLNSFGVEAKVLQVTKGPSVTRFELQPNAGVKVSKIVNLADDIALNLAAPGVRIEAPIPGKAAVGIEVPNKDLSPVFLREVIESGEFINSTKGLAVALGKDIAGNCVVADLSRMPHMLIAGATGSGKSVCINTLIVSILYKYAPEDVKLLMIDPKVVELSVYNGIPHLLIPVVTDPKKAAGALNWAVNEMTKRYKLFADNSVRNIEGYNELHKKGKISEKLPLIVMIVDELADLMMVCAHEVEDYIGRLAQMARAAGMHLVIATQRPSVDVITGVIKANIPSRISFSVSSQIDSRTILDMAGAEKLLGKGDMLFFPIGESKPLRVQGAFISEDEVEKVVSFIKHNQDEPEYRTEILDEINTKAEPEEGDSDELFEEAVRIAIEAGQASTSLIQRKLRIGYNRAARIIEQMEERGVISPKDGSKPRQILIGDRNGM